MTWAIFWLKRQHWSGARDGLNFLCEVCDAGQYWTRSTTTDLLLIFTIITIFWLSISIFRIISQKKLEFMIVHIMFCCFWCRSIHVFWWEDVWCCRWRWDWFKGASNPEVDYVQVSCPSVLTQKSGCNRGWSAYILHIQEQRSVLLFSKLNKLFFGLFDPEKVFIDNENKWCLGWPDRYFGWKRTTGNDAANCGTQETGVSKGWWTWAAFMLSKSNRAFMGCIEHIYINTAFDMKH